MPSHDPKVAVWQKQRARAVELGNAGSAAGVFELFELLKSESAEVRRLAASALGKLADVMPDGGLVAAHLSIAAERDSHPQVRQYALKALAKHAKAAVPYLDDMRDIARDPTQKEYVREAAAVAVAAAQEANRKDLAARFHWCARCRRRISEAEYLGGMERFGKPYCRHCFDERMLESKNFEAMVDEAKRRRTEDGTAVQSVGERRIADWLAERRIAYVYDERYRMAGDVQIRPDFYLPEFDLYIEYWGMDTPEYVENMKKKLFLYQRCGKRLVSVSFHDFDRIEAVLEEKLSRYIRL